jgi:flagellar biogenesis protein FliO
MAAVLFLLWGVPLATAAEGPSLLASALRTLFALAGVCALAYVVLSWLSRRGIGAMARSKSGRLEVVERVTLAPRTSLYLVRVDGRELLVGSGEAGGLSLIKDLSDASARHSTGSTGGATAGASVVPSKPYARTDEGG